MFTFTPFFVCVSFSFLFASFGLIFAERHAILAEKSIWFCKLGKIEIFETEIQKSSKGTEERNFPQ